MIISAEQSRLASLLMAGFTAAIGADFRQTKIRFDASRLRNVILVDLAREDGGAPFTQGISRVRDFGKMMTHLNEAGVIRLDPSLQHFEITISDYHIGELRKPPSAPFTRKKNRPTEHPDFTVATRIAREYLCEVLNASTAPPKRSASPDPDQHAPTSA